MNIKIIIAALVVMMLGFIGYSNYSSHQNKKVVEARKAETAAMQASNAQAMAAIKKPEIKAQALDVAPVESGQPKTVDNPIADDGVALESVSLDANKTDKIEQEKLKNAACNSVSEFSETAMGARLSGVTIQHALKTVDSSDINDAYKAAFKNVVVQAYKQPNYQTDEVKERAIREFALKQYLACADAFDKE